MVACLRSSSTAIKRIGCPRKNTITLWCVTIRSLSVCSPACRFQKMRGIKALHTSPRPSNKDRASRLLLQVHCRILMREIWLVAPKARLRIACWTRKQTTSIEEMSFWAATRRAVAWTLYLPPLWVRSHPRPTCRSWTTIIRITTLRAKSAQSSLLQSSNGYLTKLRSFGSSSPHPKSNDKRFVRCWLRCRHRVKCTSAL